MISLPSGIQLFAETHGVGPPLVTLHGGLGLDHTYLRPWLDPLGDSFRLVFFDQRGCGRSTAGPLDGVTHATWCADTDLLRRELALDKIVLFGHSYGALIALDYALAYPETLAGLVLCNATPVIDYPEVMMANVRAWTPEVFERLASTLGRPAADDAELERIWRDILPAYFHEYDPATANAMNARIRFRAAAFNQSACRCLPTFNVLPRLSEIDVPTLILAGRRDWVMTVREGAERLHAGIRGSTLRVFEASGHFPFIEEQPAWLRAVREWKAERLTGLS
jgi:proline iminopeptidase